MRSRRNKRNMVWMDLEMTGLDPEKEGIIEIATIITDRDLNILAEGPHLVIHQRPKLLGGMDSWNQKQHRKSGLLEEVKKSRVTLKEAESRTLDFLKRYCLPRQSPLSGNAVHHDRRFLIRHMPRLHRYLHYRHVDVSTIKILIDGWYRGAKDRPKKPRKREAHRALDDIRESIEELRFYRREFFKRGFV